MNYKDFLDSKQKTFIESGFEIDESQLNSNLFDFQRYSAKIALRKGRFALFQDCGLGKTIQQLEFAHQCSIKYNKPSLILAPLAVVEQTIEQGERFGYDVYRFDFENTPCENEPDIFILNYAHRLICTLRYLARYFPSNHCLHYLQYQPFLQRVIRP